MTQSYTENTEVLVPRATAWWTFLALAADPSSPSEKIAFVSELSSKSGVAIVDSRLLPQDERLLKEKSRVAVLLWDGYKGYLDHQPKVDRVRDLAPNVELWIVGDLGDFQAVEPTPCKQLFVQEEGCYSRSIFQAVSMRRFSFDNAFTKFEIVNRSSIISLKVLLQLLKKREWSHYARTKYVYCGLSGLEILEFHCARYGVETGGSFHTMLEQCSRRELISRWVAAVQRRSQGWPDKIVMRALLRFLGLSALLASGRQDLFLNLSPKTNKNVYQAGRLFKDHIFLDFGGINGDELVYPRAADILLQGRRTIRYDLKPAMKRLLDVSPDDDASVLSFLSWYDDLVLSGLDKSKTTSLAFATSSS